MRKIKPGRVAYAVWCDDQGQVIDDGTIFHLKQGEYRLCSQERHMEWFMAAAIGFDVSIKLETAEIAKYSELEYFAIRNTTGIFDLTPMTKYRITGPDALDYLDRLVTRDMRKIKPGRVAYAAWCDDEGQVIDDGTIFHLRDGEYRLCSQERHMEWFTAAAIGFDVTIKLETADIAGLAVQGPTSYSVLNALGVDGLENLKFFGLMHCDFQGTELMVSRTGYTGDLGYEIWINADFTGVFLD